MGAAARPDPLAPDLPAGLAPDASAAPLALPALDTANLAERVDALRLQLVSQTMLRVPAILLLSNLFAAWLLWRTGWVLLAPLWFVLMSAVHGGRWWLVKRWQRLPPITADGNRALAWAVMAVLVWDAVRAAPTGPRSRSPVRWSR